MNLLKLPADLQEFLLKLDDPKEIRKFLERRLRNKQKLSCFLLVFDWFIGTWHCSLTIDE